MIFLHKKYKVQTAISLVSVMWLDLASKLCGGKILNALKPKIYRISEYTRGQKYFNIAIIYGFTFPKANVCVSMPRIKA